MSYTIVGLGNPGEEYESTRHNTGRIVLEYIAKKNEIEGWKKDKVLNSTIAKGNIAGENVLLILPETFMNKSGNALRPLITSAKKAESLVVIHDDLDLPLGKFRIVFNRGAGGHKGVESIVRNIKTEKFIRIRVGITPTTPTGKLKKPAPEKILNFIIGQFKKDELDEIKKVAKKINEALEIIVAGERQRAMTEYN